MWRDVVVARAWPRPTILGHDRGLAASPPVRYTLVAARCQTWWAASRRRCSATAWPCALTPS